MAAVGYQPSSINDRNKENVLPSGPAKGRRMRLEVFDDDDESIVRVCTPKKEQPVVPSPFARSAVLNPQQRGDFGASSNTVLAVVNQEPKTAKAADDTVASKIQDEEDEEVVVMKRPQRRSLEPQASATASLNVTAEAQAVLSALPGGSAAPLVTEETALSAEAAAPEDPAASAVEEGEKATQRVAAREQTDGHAEERRKLYEAKYSELAAFTAGDPETVRRARSAVEERMSSIEEAWRKKVASLSTSSRLIEQFKNASLASLSARSRTTTAGGTASASSAPSPASGTLSPSIEERKQRLARLRSERLEMKQKLEATKTATQRKEGKKKSLRWADEGGESLSTATTYLVEGPAAADCSAPPPLPASPAPSSIPVQYLAPE